MGVRPRRAVTRRGHFIVRGQVQGVCYRMDARDLADQLGITGWVRNRPDGTVEVLAEADELKLKQFLAWCRQGPPHGQVSGVEESYAEATGEFDGFRIAF